MSLLLVVCTHSVEEFTTPVAGEYKLECWGAGDLHNGGGYSYGNTTLNLNFKLYVCVGGQGEHCYGYKGGLGGYNGGGKAGDGSRIDDSGNAHEFVGGFGGSGATHIGYHTGLLNKFESDYTTQLLLVAGGAGGSSNGFYGSGFGGGSEGGKPSAPAVHVIVNENKIQIKPARSGTSANQIIGYKFGEGQQGMTKSKYGNMGAEGSGGGGGGLYGGFSPHEEGDGANWAGGGGSGYVNTILTNAKTIAGDTKLPSPNGGTEETTGHSGDGACIITQVSF